MTLPALLGPPGDWTPTWGLDFTAMTMPELTAAGNSGWFSKGWNTATGGGGSAPNNLNWFSPGLLSLLGDGLHLACSDTAATIGGVTYPRGAAMFQTSGISTFVIPAEGMAFQIVARWPTLTSVAGSWPAWWLLSNANSDYGAGPYPWPPEIDLCEWNPSQGHVQGLAGASPAYGTATGDQSEGFHTRTVVVTAETVSAWLDNTQLSDKITSPALAAYIEADTPWYHLLNSSVNSLKATIPSDFVVSSIQTFVPGTTPPPAEVTYSGSLKGSDGSTLTLSGTLTP